MLFQSSDFEVLSIVFRADGYQWAGPTQLLPQNGSVSDEQSLTAAREFSQTLKTHGGIPESASQCVRVAPDSFRWKEFRTATKNVLCALGNALANSLPPGFNMAACRPPNVLVPAGIHGERFSLLEDEKKIHGAAEIKGDCKFICDFKKHCSVLDYYVHDNFVHLVFAADEGAEVGQVPNM